MKNILTILIAATAIFAVTEILAQDPSDNPSDPADEAAGAANTSDNTASANNTATDDDDDDDDMWDIDDDETDTNSTTTDDKNPPTTTDDENNDTNSTTTDDDNNDDSNSTETSAVIPPPTLMADCMMVYKECVSDEDTVSGMACQVVGNTVMCLGMEKTVENETYSCGDGDIKKVQEYCFSYEMLVEAERSSVAKNCEHRVAEVSQDKVSTVTDYSHTCQFLDKFKEEFLKAGSAGSAHMCTSVEFDSVHKQVCLACRGAMASLLLVVAMLAAQRFIASN